MANRLRGNVYIIDSQTGISASLQPGTASWLDDSVVSNVCFWAADTTGLCEFVLATNSNDVVIKLSAGGTPLPASGSTSDMHFAGDGVKFSELRCKTLTAGTAWIYFT